MPRIYTYKKEKKKKDAIWTTIQNQGHTTQLEASNRNNL